MRPLHCVTPEDWNKVFESVHTTSKGHEIFSRAVTGDAEALGSVSCLLVDRPHGSVTPKMGDKQMRIYKAFVEAAAVTGDARCMHELGLLLECQENNTDQALEWYRKARDAYLLEHPYEDQYPIVIDYQRLKTQLGVEEDENKLQS